MEPSSLTLFRGSLPGFKKEIEEIAVARPVPFSLKGWENEGRACDPAGGVGEL